MAGLADRLPGQSDMAGGRSIATARFEFATVRGWPVARQVLLCIVLLYLAKQAINVFLFPPFSGHDEVAHFSYIRTVATEYRVPIIPDLEEFRAWIGSETEPPGDYFAVDLYKHCRYVLDWSFCEDARWANNPPMIVTVGPEYYPHGWQYAANHPPLYYVLMAPIYRVSNGASPETQHYLLRLAAIPFGLATVLLAYAIVRVTFPRDRFLAITVPAFVALQPQVSYEAAMVNNDIAGIAIYSLLLYLIVLGIRRGFTTPVTAWIGFALGVGLLLKSTTLTIVPIIAFAVIFGSGIRHVRAWLSRGVAIAGIAGLVSWPWYLFLYRTYGNFSALDQVADLQWAWTYRNREKPTVVDQLLDSDFALMRWKETWGEFGWRLIHLNDRLLWAIGIPIILATAGLLGYLIAIGVRWRPGKTGTGVAALDRSQVIVIVMMVLTAILAYLAVLQFGTRFSLTQSRYMFPAIIAFAFSFMIGLKAMTPLRAERYVEAAVVAALVLMNVVIYTQYVIPYWYLAS